MKKRYLWLLVLMLGMAPGAQAAQPGQIKQTIGQSIKTREVTQKKAADWQGNKERMKNRYFQLKESIDMGRMELAHMEEVTAKQNAYLDRTRRKVHEMEKIGRELQPYLQQQVARLSGHIKNDLPFLAEERATRIDTLHTILNDIEIPLSEKLRRTFEAMRVEMDYGKSIETTRTEIDYKGQKVLVNMLRLGRTALLMQTIDEQESALYAGGAWKELPGQYGAEIKKAMEITQRRRPVDFVNLPLREIKQ
ncbi:MAG: DUF3450 domain-containing protein [Deltaproteobacteria bacterium]|nr:DUF3450 domain-containing protein [Deltaproteobacteria bacterium]